HGFYHSDRAPLSHLHVCLETLACGRRYSIDSISNVFLNSRVFEQRLRAFAEDSYSYFASHRTVPLLPAGASALVCFPACTGAGSHARDTASTRPAPR